MITPGGTSAACFGDSVGLMASIGLNFTYEWFKDGTPLRGHNHYLLSAKEGGSYTVQVTSPSGCKTLSAPVTVTIHHCSYDSPGT